MFRTVSDIPPEFIKKGVSLRGEVKAVGEDSTLHVLHVPPLKGFWSSGQPTSGTQHSVHVNQKLF